MRLDKLGVRVTTNLKEAVKDNQVTESTPQLPVELIVTGKEKLTLSPYPSFAVIDIVDVPV